MWDYEKLVEGMDDKAAAYLLPAEQRVALAPARGCLALATVLSRAGQANSSDVIGVFDLLEDGSVCKRHELQGHECCINSVVWSAGAVGGGASGGGGGAKASVEGKGRGASGIIASGSDDATVRLWDAAKGCLLAKLTGHFGSVLGVALSKRGDALISASADKTVRVWKNGGKPWASGASLCKAVLRGHSDDVQHVSFNSDGSICVSAGDDGTARLWDVALAQAAQATPVPGHLNPATPITASVWTLRGTGQGAYDHVIVSADTLGVIKCWGKDGLSPVWSSQLNSKDAVNKTAITSLCALPGRALVAAGMFGLVHVVSTEKGAPLQTLQVREWVNCLAAAGGLAPAPAPAPGSLAAHVIVAAGEDNTLRLWRWSDGAVGPGKVVAGVKAGGKTPPAKSGGGVEAGGFDDGIGVLEAVELGDVTGCDVMGGEVLPMAVVTGGRDGMVNVWRVEGVGGGKAGLKRVWSCDSGTGDVGGLTWVAFKTSAHSKDSPGATGEAAQASGAGRVIAATSAGGEVLLMVSGEGGGVVSRCAIDAAIAGAKLSLSWCQWAPRLDYVVASSAAKMIYVFRVCGGLAMGGSGGAARVGAPETELRLAALFPAQGQFGSPDGIGGQGDLSIGGAGSGGGGVGKGVKMAIGDRGGRLYVLCLSNLKVGA